nr:Cna B-type domain-containing protein [Solobacterium sp.]
AIVGAGDWKDYENLSKEEYEWFDGNWDESWLGMINVEVYKDGKLWCEPLPLYYMYHNDNSADLNVKFVVDDLLAEYEDSYKQWGSDDDPPIRTQLDNYLLDGDVFPEASQVDDYVIDYVVAKQGSKEDGLMYRLNWMSESGGQLDNVRGGSTVKIYVTTKYQEKYFLDGVSWDEASGKLVPALDDNGVPTDSVELTKAVTGVDTWVNVLDYATTQTEEAAAGNEVDITVSEDENNGIFDRDVEDVSGDKWYMPPDEDLRSTFGTYFYDINKYVHEIPTAEAPASLVPEGYVLDDGSVWEIRDADDNTVAEVAVNSSFLVHVAAGAGGSSVADAGLTDQAYKGSDDALKTYHLYMKILKGPEEGVTEISATKVWDDNSNEAQARPSAEEFKAKLHLMNGETEVTGYEAKVTDKGDNTYTITYEGLPATDADGKAITYKIKEDEISGYEAVDGTEVGDGGTMTNKHEPTDDTDDTDDTDQTDSDESPDTGDTTNIALIALIALAAMAIAIMLIVRRRREE